ncbi:hypothetical protein GCM10010885_14300 [Alicyclobacillus cellulosilyticus]|uniref:Membrane protein required for colicin V production n=1 Tax=Alicyclobacillus cellulosilyticus TaxID=1003997 RepID=A0A917KAC0_9BACL|nr:hypothetical protein GCM10010885_14300 [Alicyclobacillus cellulosilyticus]
MRVSTADLVIAAIILLGGLNGYRTGFIRQVTRLFGAVIAYGLSLYLRPYVAPVIRGMHLFPQWPASGLASQLLGDLSDAMAFAAVFVVTFFLLRYAVGLIETLFSLPVISWLNRMAGLAVGLVFALLFVYVGALIAQYIADPPLQHALHQSVILHGLGVFSKPALGQTGAGGLAMRV